MGIRKFDGLNREPYLAKTCWVLEGAGFEEPEPIVGREKRRWNATIALC